MARTPSIIFSSWFIFTMVALVAWGPAAEARETVAGGVRQDWAKPVDLPGSDNFFRVTDSLYRAAQPDREGMEAYAAFGIRTVINLRNSPSDKEIIRGLDMQLVEIPTRTWEAGSDATVIRALQAIRDAQKPVLVHCRHGADRTGLVIAMYRIVEQGWTKEQALDEMHNGGFGFHSIWRNIPAYIENADTAFVRKALIERP